jgi:hypothetical protein
VVTPALRHHARLGRGWVLLQRPPDDCFFFHVERQVKMRTVPPELTQPEP